MKRLLKCLCLVLVLLFGLSAIFDLFRLAHISLSLRGVVIICSLVMRVELIRRVLHIACTRLTVVRRVYITLCIWVHVWVVDKLLRHRQGLYRLSALLTLLALNNKLQHFELVFLHTSHMLHLLVVDELCLL